MAAGHLQQRRQTRRPNHLALLQRQLAVEIDHGDPGNGSAPMLPSWGT